jgi:serine phosphatase RsbU (regulator of sigma subunit)
MGQPLEPEDMRVPRRVIQESLYRRRDLFSMSIDPEHSEIDAQKAGETIVAMELRSVVCVPVVRIRLGLEHETSRLTPGEDTLGVLYMDSREAGRDLAAGSQDILQSLAIEISSVLENARLLAEQRQKRRLEDELEIARQIQQSMLPPELPSEGWFVAAGSSEACFQVGGDYFDVMKMSPESWAAVMVDVSGKGVSAALLTSLIQGAFFSTTSPDGSLSDNVGRINRYISERSRGAKFATVFYCAIRRDGLFRWVNAGHCPAFLARSSGVIETLDPSSHPMGIFAETAFPEHHSQLSAGDKLVVYTDGVSEATNWAHEQFGEERLRAAVSRNAKLDAAKLFEALHEEVDAFTSGAAQKDDLTLLVLGFQG